MPNKIKERHASRLIVIELVARGGFEVIDGMGSGVEPIVSVEFEVYGKVQGVYFTKYCKEMSQQLNLTGWIKNSKKGTIVGKVQGMRPTIEQMIIWLTETGSPGSKIDHCDLTNWESLATPDYKDFSIRF